MDYTFQYVRFGKSETSSKFKQRIRRHDRANHSESIRTCYVWTGVRIWPQPPKPSTLRKPELDVAKSAGRVPHEQAALISSSVPSLLTDLEPLTGAPTLRASKEIIADDAIGSSCYRRSALASRGILSPQIAFSGNANEKLVENVACATVQAATTLPFRFAATCKSIGKTACLTQWCARSLR